MASPSASAAASASTGPSAAPSQASCGDLDVDATITRWEGAAGSRIAMLEVKNVGGSACELGAPTVEKLLDGLGQPLITSTGDKAVGSDVTLANDQTAQLLVQVANWCTAKPAVPVSIEANWLARRFLRAKPMSKRENIFRR